MSTRTPESTPSADTPGVSPRLARPTRVHTDETHFIAGIGDMHGMLARAGRVHRIQVLCGSSPAHSGWTHSRGTV
ncbi:MAG: hypothetical protein WBD41_02730 [Rhodococcus sp. (in: high G+C Gram-positive bacteria)]